MIGSDNNFKHLELLYKMMKKIQLLARKKTMMTNLFQKKKMMMMREESYRTEYIS